MSLASGKAKAELAGTADQGRTRAILVSSRFKRTLPRPTTSRHRQRLLPSPYINPALLKRWISKPPSRYIRTRHVLDISGWSMVNPPHSTSDFYADQTLFLRNSGKHTR